MTRPRAESDAELLLRRLNNVLRHDGRRVRSRAPDTAKCEALGRYYLIDQATGRVLDATVDLLVVAAAAGVSGQPGHKRRSPYRAPAPVQQRELVAIRDVGVAAARAAMVDIRAHVSEPAAGWLALVELSHLHGWASTACRAFVETLTSAATGRPAR
ncbi:MAG: hypothetical protein ABI699_07890 [Caldimonas sp.]